MTQLWCGSIWDKKKVLLKAHLYINMSPTHLKCDTWYIIPHGPITPNLGAISLYPNLRYTISFTVSCYYLSPVEVSSYPFFSHCICFLVLARQVCLYFSVLSFYIQLIFRVSNWTYVIGEALAPLQGTGSP